MKDLWRYGGVYFPVKSLLRQMGDRDGGAALRAKGSIIWPNKLGTTNGTCTHQQGLDFSMLIPDFSLCQYRY